MTRRRQFLATVGAGSMAIAFSTHAQVQPRVRRIGYLASADPATTGGLAGLALLCAPNKRPA